tara:strand:+ start:575 stop:1015 length:441 start_codon:yes stop_codon:yes gene_type:complete
MSKDQFENAPLEYALRKTYLEYLSENNLDVSSGIIPFSYLEVIRIFHSIGEHYSYDWKTDLAKRLNNPGSSKELEFDPLRKLNKELSDYEEIVFKNLHRFSKKFIKQFIFKYENLSDNEKNNREGYKKALLSSEEFIIICSEIESD